VTASASHARATDGLDQHPVPQAHPSPHWMWLPTAHVTLQFPVLAHRTRHAPSHVTSQLPTDVHATELPSPTCGAQSFTLSHTYRQSVPHSA
jgi:hypothetical protein